MSEPPQEIKDRPSVGRWALRVHFVTTRRPPLLNFSRSATDECFFWNPFIHQTVDELFYNFFHARGHKSKLVDLNIELSNLSVKPHVILITETWFDSDVIISDFIGSYYDVLPKDRNKFSGGMMLMDKNLHSECLETLHINDVVDSSWCKFKINNEIFVFGIIYKLSNCSNEYVDKMVDHVNDIVELNQHCNFFLSRDFNFPSVDWKIPYALSNKCNENKFIECIINNGLIQIVNFPTRKDNILDLIFCIDTSYISWAHCVEPLVLSDHENIILVLI